MSGNYSAGAAMMELVAPAGSPEALDAAIGEGADAVYLGLKNFNARIHSKNFAYSQLEGALHALHRNGKKLYVTVNTVFEQREADRMYQLLGYLADLGPDALIVQDFGVISMANSYFPSLRLHASTQMNIAGVQGVNALSRHGLSRVVLARELSLEELQAIRAQTNMELEVFVHGALCVSVSGICLFSGYFGGKSANRGMCTQACRRLYHCADSGGIAGAGDASSGGYYFSPHDLQLLPHLPDLAAAGINALKIEGRMKSADYVGTVVSAYRMVIDAVSEGNEEKISQSIASGLEILRSDFARPKTSYFFLASGGTAPAIDWLNPGQDGGTGIFLGSIRKTENLDSEKIALVDGSGAAYVPRPGDTVRLHRSDDSGRVTHKLVYAEKVKSPAASGSAFRISVPDDVSPGDRVNLIQVKSMSRRYKPVITRIGSGRGPGREKAPVPEIFRNESSASVNSGTGSGKSAKKAAFPEGLYVAVSRIEDLYILQSSRPIRVMLSFNAKTRPYLVSDAGQPGLQKPGLIKPGFIKPLPFRPAEMILVLDPFYPQADSDAMADSIGQLVKRGYRQFVVNNPGHFSLFRDYSGCELIAGPWLYIFNRWAFSFIASHGIGGFISPYENNRQNLERTAVSGMERSRFFVPVFARPPLFHIRSNLGAFYNFSSFSDSRDAQFTLDCGPDGSVVASDIPFSIADKTPFLKEAGFRRFIIDLGGITIRKSDYRDLMYAAANGIPLPHTSRFNWKDGFFVGE